MTDQTTPVTDDDRKAHEWADDVVRRPDFHEDWDQPIARAIKAHVPVPPKSLADELREMAAQVKWPLDDRLDDLADRVEAVEVENVGLRIERDQADYLMQKADRERDEALAEVVRGRELIRKHKEQTDRAIGDRDAALAEVERLRTQTELVCDRRDDLIEERDEARAEVERLTAERLDRNPETKARVEAALDNLDKVETVTVQKAAESNAETPDPADVKPGEAWLVEVGGERRNAVKDGVSDVPWNTVGWNGGPYSKRNEEVTLIARLTPEKETNNDQ